jgi:hypothetical protein
VVGAPGIPGVPGVGVPGIPGVPGMAGSVGVTGGKHGLYGDGRQGTLWADATPHASNIVAKMDHERFIAWESFPVLSQRDARGGYGPARDSGVVVQ